MSLGEKIGKKCPHVLRIAIRTTGVVSKVVTNVKICLMDYLKLRPLPRPVPVAAVSDESRYFKTFKKRFTHETGVSSDVTAIEFNPESEVAEFAVACGTRVSVLRYEGESVSVVHNLTKHKELVTALAYRSDGQLLAAADGSGQANIYSMLGSHGMLRRLKGHEGAVSSMRFGFGKESLWTAGKDSVVKVWDIPTGQTTSVLAYHTDTVKALSVLTPAVTASAGYDGNICLWDVRSGSSPVAVYEHGSQVECVANFPSGALMVSGGPSGLKTWDIAQGICVNSTPTLHSRALTAAVVSSSGNHLWTSSLDGTVKVRDTVNMEISSTYTGSTVTALAVKGSAFIAGTETGSVVYRDRRTVDNSAQVETSGEGYFMAPSSAPRADSQIDFLLRKFEYKKLLDLVVSGVGCNHLQGLAALDELNQRGAVQAALRGRDSVEISSVISWLSKVLVAYPSYTPLVVKSLHAVLDMAGDVNGGLSEAVAKLQAKISQEILLEDRLLSLQGSLETIISHC